MLKEFIYSVYNFFLLNNYIIFNMCNFTTRVCTYQQLGYVTAQSYTKVYTITKSLPINGIYGKAIKF